MSSKRLTAEQEVKLRATYSIKFDTLVEFGVLDADSTPTRRALNEYVHSLGRQEQKILERRLNDAMDRVDDILEGDQQSFDEPHIEHEDLVDGVGFVWRNQRYR